LYKERSIRKNLQQLHFQSSAYEKNKRARQRRRKSGGYRLKKFKTFRATKTKEHADNLRSMFSNEAYFL
jgi:hypothetical protein